MGVTNFIMKKIILLAVCMCIGIFVIRTFQISNSKIQRENVITIGVGSQNLSVEVAKTTAEISLGLGQRDTLGSDGMLFVMPSRAIPTFWMKDMRFDLDFVWIDGSSVIDLTENVSAQRGEPDSALRIYAPKSPATHVLELNAGEIKKRGIKVGDSVKL